MARNKEMYTPSGDTLHVLSTIQRSLARSPRFRDAQIRGLIGHIDINSSGEMVSVQPSVSENELFALVSGDLRRGIYAEVGVGRFRRKINRIFTAESPYIGFDSHFDASAIGGGGSGGWGIRDDSHAEELTRELQSANDQNPHMRIRIGDGRSLPLAAGSVQEVFMGDVLVSPDFSIQTVTQLLAEAKRVLDPSTGVLVIGEEDYWSDSFRERFILLDILLARVGFERTSITSSANANRIIDILGWPREDDEKMKAEFILAKPVTEQSVRPRRV